MVIKRTGASYDKTSKAPESNARTLRHRLPGMAGSPLFTGFLLLAPAAFGREINSRNSIDANAIVRRMMSTYQSAQAFEETSEAKVTEQAKPEYIQQTTLRFKRPNLLYLSSEDPSIGTYQGFCNGKTITVYAGTTNTYTKRNSPVNLRDTMTRFTSAGKALLTIDIVQMLSPISFMTAKSMPNECKNFRFDRMDVVDGSKVAVVTGLADSDWLISAGIPQKTVFDSRKVTLWVDTNQNLLRRAACDLRWHASGSANRPGDTTAGSLKFVETHHSARVNPPLRDEDFFFSPPKGATEVFQNQR